MTFCPKCKRIAEFDTYYNRYYCTCCNWSSESLDITPKHDFRKIKKGEKIKLKVVTALNHV